MYNYSKSSFQNEIEYDQIEPETTSFTSMFDQLLFNQSNEMFETEAPSVEHEVEAGDQSVSEHDVSVIQPDLNLTDDLENENENVPSTGYVTKFGRTINRPNYFSS
jgi:hypothetical protein